jgi:choice-of-anchor C domain-containing protein
MGIEMKTKTLVGVASILVPASLFAAPVLLNGSFEVGGTIAAQGYTTVSQGGTSVTNWTIASGSVDYISTYWKASEGNRSLDLNGNGMGTISQPITGLIPNTSYRLTFDVAGNPDGAPNIKTLTAQVGSRTAETYSFTTIPGAATRSNMGWVTMTYLFTTGAAEPSSQVLTFASTTTGSFGPVLDNVVVSVIPEPGTAMGLGILSGASLLLGRRRQRA